MIYKLVTEIIQYFCFPDRPMKSGTSWISRKGGILEKLGWSRKGGGYNPLTNYESALSDRQTDKIYGSI